MRRCGEIIRSSSAWQCRSVSPLLLTLALLLLLLLQAEQRLAVPVREEALHLQLQRQVEQREATLLVSAHAS